MPDPIRTARVASGSDADAAPDGVDADASASLERALALERAKTTTLEEELRRVRSSAEKLAQTVEAEEEFLVRTLNKKLDALTHENATLTHAMRTQRVDDALERRLRTLQEEKVQMENALEREQECMMHRLTSVLENLGRENQSVSKERDRLSFETARLKEEKVRMENALESEEEHIVNLLQGQISLLLKRNRALERQVRALGGTVSDSDYVSDDPVMSPKRASGQFAFGSARDAFANRKTRPAGSSVPTSPFESDRSMSPSRRGVEARRTSNASARSISSESRSPRTSVDRTS
jgi:coiled-coil domain-containing protein 6